jgi:hypothetical protein
VVYSGALGGPHEGRVVEMGLVYLTLETDQGLIRLPNSAVLNSGVAPNGKASRDNAGTASLAPAPQPLRSSLRCDAREPAEEPRGD